MQPLSPRLAALCALLLASSAISAPPSSISAPVSSAVLSSAPGVVSTASISISTSSGLQSSAASISSVIHPTSSVALSSVSSALSVSLSSAPVPISSIASSVPASSSVSLSGVPSTVVSGSVSASTTFSISASAPTSASAISASSAPANASTTAAVPIASQSFNSGTGIETGRLTIPISSYGFTAFPTASAPAIPGVFPSASPASPPPVGSTLIPDFSNAWNSAWNRATSLVSGFSTEDKVNVVTGTGWENGRCVGNIPAVGDFPGLCLEDSPLGVRDTDFASAFPAGITVAQSWNRTLFRERGVAMGQEHKGKGVNVQLGPMMNIGRVAQGGRNWEGFGAEPFLTGEAAYETILGIQSAGVQACAKHFINNEQEYKRTQESSYVEDRTEHEIYLHPFMRSVIAGVASVMCSYNLVNDTYACENDRTINQLLKGELGFRGYVMSDWGAQEGTLDAVAGLDMSMPGDITLGSHTSWWGSNLTDFVENGTIAESRLDDMATRIIASWYLLGQNENYPAVNFNAFEPLDEATNEHVDVQSDHYKLIRTIGAHGTVLLKNNNGALPLNKPRSIAIIGSDAADAAMGPNGYSDRGGDDGVLAMGWGSGTANFPYLIAPVDAIQDRARQDSTSVSWWFQDWDTNGAASAAVENDVALVFVNADSGEGYITVDGNEGDRKNLSLWHNADNLINAVAASNPNTVVIAHSVGPSIIEAWVDNPNVTALLWAALPGQEAGNSIVDVLYGAHNPYARLAYTIAKNLSDYPTSLTLGGGPNDIISIPYTEGLFVDYRHFDANNIEPRYEFGFGLSYSSFTYSNLKISKIAEPDHSYTQQESAWADGQPSANVEGEATAIWLHRPAFEVTFDIQNTGGVDGGEIPQLYLHFPASADEPPSVLKGFTDVSLRSGQRKSVTLTLSRYDLSIWDVVAQGWVKPEGTFTFSVGASSRDLRLQGTVPL